MTTEKSGTLRDPKVISAIVAIVAAVLGFTAKTYYSNRADFEAATQADIRELRVMATKEKVKTDATIEVYRLMVERMSKIEGRLYEIHTGKATRKAEK